MEAPSLRLSQGRPGGRTPQDPHLGGSPPLGGECHCFPGTGAPPSPVSSHFADEGVRGPWLSVTGPQFSQSSKGAEPCLSNCVCPWLPEGGELVTSHLHPNKRLSPGPWGGAPGSAGCLNSTCAFFWRRPKTSPESPRSGIAKNHWPS